MRKKTIHKALRLLFVMSVSLIGFMACQEDEIPEVEDLPTLVEAAEDAGLTSLLDAVNAAELASELLEAESITVLAPNNQAFTNLLNQFELESLDELVNALGADALSQVLRYHVIPSEIVSADIAEEETEVVTLSGETLTVQRSGNTVTFTDFYGSSYSVQTADVEIENGVVHIINGVLLPDLGLEPDLPNLVEAAEAANLNTLLAAVEIAEVGEALLSAESITVFAPTNQAFDALLAELELESIDELIELLGGSSGLANVLQYHVLESTVFAADVPEEATEVTTLNGENITVQRTSEGVSITDVNGNSVTVTTEDVAIENGVVHVINGVLLPELDLPKPTIVEAATAAGLTTLLDAVTAADLGNTLLDAEAITVFAPTNDAFGAALERFEASNLDELVEAIGGIENLQTVLGFHVVPAVAFSGDLSASQTFTTLAGQDITVNVDGGTVTVLDAEGNAATVTTADVEIANGVVHVIDAVLIPSL